MSIGQGNIKKKAVEAIVDQPPLAAPEVQAEQPTAAQPEPIPQAEQPTAAQPEPETKPGQIDNNFAKRVFDHLKTIDKISEKLDFNSFKSKWLTHELQIDKVWGVINKDPVLFENIGSFDEFNRKVHGIPLSPEDVQGQRVSDVSLTTVPIGTISSPFDTFPTIETAPVKVHPLGQGGPELFPDPGLDSVADEKIIEDYKASFGEDPVQNNVTKEEALKLLRGSGKEEYQKGFDPTSTPFASPERTEKVQQLFGSIPGITEDIQLIPWFGTEDESPLLDYIEGSLPGVKSPEQEAKKRSLDEVEFNDLEQKRIEELNAEPDLALDFLIVTGANIFDVPGLTATEALEQINLFAPHYRRDQTERELRFIKSQQEFEALSPEDKLRVSEANTEQLRQIQQEEQNKFEQFALDNPERIEQGKQKFIDGYIKQAVESKEKGDRFLIQEIANEFKKGLIGLPKNEILDLLDRLPREIRLRHVVDTEKEMVAEAEIIRSLYKEFGLSDLDQMLIVPSTEGAFRVKENAIQRIVDNQWSMQREYERFAKKGGLSTSTPEDAAIIKRGVINNRLGEAVGFLTEDQREIYELVSQQQQRERKLRKKDITEEERETLMHQLSVLKNNIAEQKGNKKQLFELSGENAGNFVDRDFATEEAQEYADFVQIEELKYADKDISSIISVWSDMLSRFKMIDAEVNKPLKVETSAIAGIGPGGVAPTQTRIVETTYLEAAKGLGVGFKELPEAQQRKAERLWDTWKTIRGQFDAVNRAFLLNEDPSGLTKGFFALFAEHMIEGFGVDITSDADFIEKYPATMKQMGGLVTKAQEDAARETTGNLVAKTLGDSMEPMVELIASTFLLSRVAKLKSLKDFGKSAKNFLTGKFGKAGTFAYHVTKGQIQSGMSFGLTSNENLTVAMGIGEGTVQGVLNGFNVEKLLEKTKWGKILTGLKVAGNQIGIKPVEFSVRTLSGTIGETAAEYTGDFINNLSENGFNVDQAFSDTFGRTPEDQFDKLLITGISSLIFSGTSNSFGTKSFFYTKSLVEDMPDSPKKKATIRHFNDPIDNGALNNKTTGLAFSGVTLEKSAESQQDLNDRTQAANAIAKQDQSKQENVKDESTLDQPQTTEPADTPSVQTITDIPEQISPEEKIAEENLEEGFRFVKEGERISPEEGEIKIDPNTQRRITNAPKPTPVAIPVAEVEPGVTPAAPVVETIEQIQADIATPISQLEQTTSAARGSNNLFTEIVSQISDKATPQERNKFANRLSNALKKNANIDILQEKERKREGKKKIPTSAEFFATVPLNEISESAALTPQAIAQTFLDLKEQGFEFTPEQEQLANTLLQGTEELPGLVITEPPQPEVVPEKPTPPEVEVAPEAAPEVEVDIPTKISELEIGKRGIKQAPAIRAEIKTLPEQQQAALISELEQAVAKREKVLEAKAKKRAVTFPVPEGKSPIGVRKPQQQASSNQETNISGVVDGVLQRISKALPKIEIITNQQEFNEAAVEAGWGKDLPENKLPNGFVFEGRVYINPSKAKPDTAIEEFAHVWIALAKETSRSVYNAGLKLADGSKYHEAVKKEKEYADRTEEEKLDEALARAITDQGAKIVEKSAFSTWLKKFWDAIKRLIGLTPRINLAETTLEQFSKKAAKELLNQTPISEIDTETLAKIQDGERTPSVIVSKSIMSPKNSRADKVRTWVDKGFKVDKGAGPGLELLRREALNAISRHKSSMGFILIDFNKSLADEVKKIPKDKRKAGTQKILELVNESLQVQGTSTTLLPELLQAPVERMRTEIDNLTEELRDSKVLAGDEILAVLNQNLGIYLHRSYMKHDVPNYTENYKKFMTNAQYVDAVNFLKDNYEVSNISSVRFEKNTLGETLYTFVNSAGIETDPLTINISSEMMTDILGEAPIKRLLKKVKKNNKGSIKLDAPSDIQEIIKFRITSEKTETLIDAILDKGVSTERIVLGGKIDAIGVGKVESSILKKKGEIAPEIRALMGEYIDPRVNFTKTITKMAALLEKAKFEQELLSQGEGTFLTKTRTSINTAEIKESQSRGLKKMWVPPEIHNLLFGKDSLFDSGKLFDGKFAQGLIFLNGLTKANLTIFKDDSQARNFWGAAMNMMAMGHLPTGLIDAIKVGTADFSKAENFMTIISSPLFILNVIAGASGKKSKETLRNEFTDAVNFGLIDEALDPGIINSLIDQVADVGSPNKAWTKTKRFAKNKVKLFSKPYQLSDNIFKISAWKKEIDAHIKAFPDLTENQIKRMAADKVRKMQPTYSNASLFTKELSKFPLVGSFVMFAGQMWRTRANIIAIASNEISEGVKTKNSQLVKMGLKRVVGLAAMASTVPILAAVSRAIFGISDKEDEEIGRNFPGYSENSIRLYTSPDLKKPKFLDMSFIDPMSIFQKPIVALMRGDDLHESLQGFSKELTNPFIGEEIFVQHIGEAMRNRDAYEQKIANDQLGAAEQFGIRLAHVSGILLPGYVTTAKNITKGALEAETDYGKVFDFWTEIINSRAGVKGKERDMTTSFISKQKRIWAEMNESFDIWEKALTTKEFQFFSVESRLKQANEKIKHWHGEMVKRYKGMKVLGFTDQQVSDFMDDAGVPDYMITQVQRNQLIGIDVQKEEIGRDPEAAKLSAAAKKKEALRKKKREEEKKLKRKK